MTWMCLMCSYRHHVDLVVEDGREANICTWCGASTRARAMAQAVLATMGPLSLEPRSIPPRAAGISDNSVFAQWMAAITTYSGYQFGEDPHLDLTEVPEVLHGLFEIVTCSDVLEHIAPPVQRAFVGLRQLLAPGGFAVVSVPGGDDGGTEHFPDLHDWHVDGVGDERFLVNRRSDGEVEEHHDLVWHGGDGWTLEMRRFDRPWLVRELTEAGFVDLCEFRRNWPNLGIAFEDWSRIWVARAPH